MIECTVCIELHTATQARHVLQAVQLDDQGFVHSSVTGRRLRATITASSVPALLHTLDDYLACVTVAEGVVKKRTTTKKTSPG